MGAATTRLMTFAAFEQMRTKFAGVMNCATESWLKFPNQS
jgi:hypothetical protein